MSYYEWVQNIENEQWDEEEVNAKLLRKMRRATDAVVERQQTVNQSLADIDAARREAGLDGEPLAEVDLRTAAYILAVDRVSKVTLERGIWP